MSFNPTGFQERKGQGEAAADQVRQYLQREEDYLLDSILQAFHISLEEPFTTRKAEGDAIPSRFADAIDRVIEQIDSFGSAELDRFAKEEVEIIIAHVNAAFRHYEELLEGCASQLFAELEKMRVDELADDTILGVQKVKDKVVGQINDCIAQINRLEKRLRQYRTVIRPRWSLWQRFQAYFQPVIDPAVIRKLRKVRKIVNREYDQLQMRYTEYQQLDTWASEKQRHVKNLRIFQQMDETVQSQFAEIYRLLKMLKRSQKASDLIGSELNRLLGEVSQVDDAVKTFECYEKLLSKAFFQLRRALPDRLMNAEELKAEKSQIASEIRNLRREVHVLGSTVFRYRDFVLKTHPDPYVRARLGFAESTVGPEPETTKRLVRMGHRVEGLNARFEGVAAAAEGFDPAKQDPLELGYFDELLENLDQLSLEAKRPTEASEAYQDVIRQLGEVEELYHFDRYRVMGVEKALRLALRVDRFNVLPRDRRFLDLYETHVRIRGPVPHELQAERLRRMKEESRQLLILISESKGRLSAAKRNEALEVVDRWREVAAKLLVGLQEFLDAKKEDTEISFETLLTEVRQRRFETLEFLYSYRVMMHRLQEVKQSPPHSLNSLMDQATQIEADFAYLVTHVGRSQGPMSLDQLRGLENL